MTITRGCHALGRAATFPWSRALTHLPRWHLTRHRVAGGRGGGLGVLAAILEPWRPSWGGHFVTSLTLNRPVYYSAAWLPRCWSASLLLFFSVSCEQQVFSWRDSLSLKETNSKGYFCLNVKKWRDFYFSLKHTLWGRFLWRHKTEKNLASGMSIWVYNWSTYFISFWIIN